MVDLDSESDLDMTGVGPVLPARRKGQGASGRSGSRNQGSSRRQFPGTIDPLQEGQSWQCQRQQRSSSSSDSSNSKDDSTSRRVTDSNASHTNNGSSSTSDSASSGDIPALTGTEARRLQHFGKPPELQSGHTRSQ